MKYFIRTYGCQMNEAESEKIAAWYEARGWKKAKSWQETDEIIINSCSVRESAENRVFGLVNNIEKFKNQKAKSKIMPAKPSMLGQIGTIQNSKFKKPKIILTGCMVGSALGEKRRYSLRNLKKRLPQVAEFKPEWQWGFEKIKAFKTRKDKNKAFVPIMKGCNHFCTYCVVPYAKKREISYPFEEIVCQVKELTKNGWKHIILLGQNVNSYGNDFSKREKEEIRQRFDVSIHQAKNLFALLLGVLHKTKAIKKISFLTSNPWDLTEEIIKVMKLPKIDRCFHLPLQSGDNQILRKMNRSYTAGQYIKLVEKIRKEIPEMKISTDLIVGFPGETKKAFENTLRVCQKVGFEKAYLAMYSPRPGTAAFCFKDNISPQEKKRRWRILDRVINSPEN